MVNRSNKVAALRQDTSSWADRFASLNSNTFMNITKGSPLPSVKRENSGGY